VKHRKPERPIVMGLPFQFLNQRFGTCGVSCTNQRGSKLAEDRRGPWHSRISFFGKRQWMNVDDNPFTAERLRIISIPALLILKSGHEVDRIVGVQAKAEIVRRLMLAIT
jgi:hypothetical protein